MVDVEEPLVNRPHGQSPIGTFYSLGLCLVLFPHGQSPIGTFWDMRFSKAYMLLPSEWNILPTKIGLKFQSSQSYQTPESLWSPLLPTGAAVSLDKSFLLDTGFSEMVHFSFQQTQSWRTWKSHQLNEKSLQTRITVLCSLQATGGERGVYDSPHLLFFLLAHKSLTLKKWFKLNHTKQIQIN